MADFLRVQLDKDTEVLFQDPSTDLVSQRGSGADIEDVKPELGRLQKLAKAAAVMATELREEVGPDELTVELGAGLSGEVGWFFAKSSLDASVKVTLTWKKADSGSKE